MKTKFEGIDFYSIPCAEARALGPFGGGDYPVTVECYMKREQWNSRKAAAAFYRAGASVCSGSEKERYSSIVAKLDAGNRDVDDSSWSRQQP